MSSHVYMDPDDFEIGTTSYENAEHYRDDLMWFQDRQSAQDFLRNMAFLKFRKTSEGLALRAKMEGEVNAGYRQER